MFLPSGAPALALALHHALRPDLPSPAGPAAFPVARPSAWPAPSLPAGWFASADYGTWAAVLLVALSTLAGAWLARRKAQKITVWLAIASALMLITALIELLPDAWHEASETDTPLWLLGLATAFGFAVITYFTRKGCGHSHESGSRRGRHAPGLHRRVTQVVGAALFGGVGTAAALTVHRVVEGATLALAASAVVVAALMVHSASEGLALTALLDLGRQRLAPWLLASCLSPALGVVLATLAPLPPAIVPLLLGMITGILLRTAVVGLKLAGTAGGGRLSRRHVILTAVAVLATTVLLLSAQSMLEDGPPPKAYAPAPGPAGRTVTNAQVDGTGAAARSDSHTGGGRLPVPQTVASGPHGAASMTSRDQLRQAVAGGSLSMADLLRRADATTVPIGWLLQGLPGRSADQVGRLLKTGKIAADAGVGELTNRQRRYLLRTFAPSPARHSPAD
ncbi:hypothetical protein AB0B45_20135 [Nonomuraea sp. NPDC049152]|uniref:hypothetical protein n=1 Tax=Nonomuraea sp. NPDC049152 TaxID=3154350 RepID=UPI00341053E0